MAKPAVNIAEYTVSEISAAVKRTVEDAFGYVRVRGEVFGYRGPHSSGHAYFALKDEKARLEAVIWRGVFGKLRFKPEEGLEVIATGRLTTYPGSSKYQIVIEALEPAGVGALMALLEERRKKLAAEGLFDDSRKKPLPYLPRVIGVVTSPTGAVIRDILHRLADRFPTRVIVWPVRVQGETSAGEVAAAIAGFNALAPGGPLPRPDLLIVARGGGSLEDLWGFNEEVVARAAAASEIPLISAVGHETDFTLIDFVSDRRAPTPTAAAEIAVPVRSELVANVEELGVRHHGATLRLIESGRRDLRAAARALPRAEDLFAIPRRSFDELASRLDRALSANSFAHRAALQHVAGRLSLGGLARGLGHAGERLAGLAERQQRALAVHAERKRSALSLVGQRFRVEPIAERLVAQGQRLADTAARADRSYLAAAERRRDRLAGLDQLLRSLSYTSIVARGFAVVRDADGAPVASAGAVSAGAALDIEFRDGHVAAVASGASAAPQATKPRKRPAAPAGGQGSLF